MKFRLNETEINKWSRNVLIFLAPLGIIYLGSVVVILQTPEHIVTFRDFIPSNFVVGAMVLYILNSVLDYLRKLKKEEK